jgi:hypothetical protein
LSFFDEDDEPRRTPRPRRARAAGGVAAADSQTLLVRRAIAAGVGLLVLVLLVFVVKSCRDSAKRSALENYTRDSSVIASESAKQVGEQFFALLGTGNGQAQDLTSEVSSFRVQADQQYRQAKSLDTPGEMKGAQQNLLMTLEMRRNGLEYIAARIRNALGDSGEVADKAINEIAGQMQVLLASDVIYETRTVPFVQHALDDAKVGGLQIASSRFVPSLTWLSPQTVATQLNQQLTSGGTTNGQPTGPGLHGTGLQSVTYGDVTLQPGVSNRLVYVPGQAFLVKFTNQGDNDEFQVKVTVRIKAGTEQITLTNTIPKVATKATAEARLPLDKTPPLDAAATISVQVAPVPGEKKVDNNKADYPALFTRG